MNSAINKYNLPDYRIFESDSKNDYSIWQPERDYIILGRSNSAEDSVFIEKANKDNIEIQKRPSGGETVILSPNTLVFSVKLEIKDTLKTHSYFHLINDSIIDSLSDLGVKNLSTKGISDISIGNMKILGSAIYRKTNSVFYHAVLNISEEIDRISYYLKHPKREPDYRKGRNHNEFVTSLQKAGYTIDKEVLKNKVKLNFEKLINKASN